MADVMLLLGGNIGDVERGIDRAVELIAKRCGEVIRRSTMMRTAAWGFSRPTPDFVNQAVWITTTLSPEELLNTTQQVEREQGREREVEREAKETSGEQYCSRKIDIDIIFYNESIYQSERLTIPHPLMQEREFVLRPIVEIAPKWRNASCGMSCEELLKRLI